MTPRDDDELRDVFDLETIAVVGCSATPHKAAHKIPAFMRNRGYEIVPINPYAEEILGTETYDSLSDVKERVDIVDIFRPSEEVSGIADEAIARDDVAVVWTQLGITDPDAGERIEAAGKRYVEDRCLKVEYQRLIG